MLKYRKAVMSSVVICLISSFYTWFALKSDWINIMNVSDIVFGDYTYHFIFSCLLFLLFKVDFDAKFYLHKFTSLDKYCRYTFLHGFLNLTLFFLIVVTYQWILFHLVDLSFDLKTYLLRNIILYLYMCLIIFIQSYIPFKFQKRTLILLYLFWNLEMIGWLHFSGTLLGQINIFYVLTNQSVLTLLFTVSIYAAVVLFVLTYCLPNGRMMKKWLD